MGDIKYKVTKINEDCFFLHIGAVIILDFNEGRVYSEDKTQFLSLDIALRLGLDGEQIKEFGISSMTQEQIDIIRKNRLNPDNYAIISDSKTELVLLSKRGRRRTIKKEVLK